MGTSPAFAEPISGVTSESQLTSFETESPQTLIKAVPITGLQGAETVLRIDFHPATGALFASGSTSRPYSINANTGVATPVGATQFTPTLSGTAFAFDFNPTVDHIRVVSDTGQNFRYLALELGMKDSARHFA